jgi:hypothetical protein
MREQQVRFLATTEQRTFCDLKDAFELRRDKKYVWVQRACFWVLKKIGAYYIKHTISYSRIPIEPDKFMEKLFKQRVELEDIYYTRPSQLFIGAQDYEELMGSPEIRQMLQFNAQYWVKEEGYRPEIMGLSVTIIPWMKGILVMP